MGTVFSSYAMRATTKGGGIAGQGDILMWGHDVRSSLKGCSSSASPHPTLRCKLLCACIHSFSRFFTLNVLFCRHSTTLIFLTTPFPSHLSLHRNRIAHLTALFPRLENVDSLILWFQVGLGEAFAVSDAGEVLMVCPTIFYYHLPHHFQTSL